MSGETKTLREAQADLKAQERRRADRILKELRGGGERFSAVVRQASGEMGLSTPKPFGGERVPNLVAGMVLRAASRRVGGGRDEIFRLSLVMGADALRHQAVQEASS